jgi:hypothetical protein
MFNNKIYITIHQKDYKWPNLKPNYLLHQKITCKRLSIPKFINNKIIKYSKIYC